MFGRLIGATAAVVVVVALIDEHREGGTAEAAKQTVAVVFVALQPEQADEPRKGGRGCTRSRITQISMVH